MNPARFRVANTLKLFLNLLYIAEIGKWVSAFDDKQNKLTRNINLKLIRGSIIDLAGAKDAKIHTSNKKLALTLIKFVKILDLPNQIIEVKWFMNDVPLTALHQVTPYFAHIEFWLNALEDKLGLDQSCFSIVLPKQLKTFRPHFERYAKTVVSEDGKYFKYKAPGHVAIEIKQTNFYSDQRKDADALPSRPRRRKSFVSFLRLVAVYLTVQAYRHNAQRHQASDHN